GGAHGLGGAEVRSGDTISRLRFTITRSSLTETRYRSRPRGAPGPASPRSLKRVAPDPLHAAVKNLSGRLSRVSFQPTGHARPSWSIQIARNATVSVFERRASQNACPSSTSGAPKRFGAPPTGG